ARLHRPRKPFLPTATACRQRAKAPSDRSSAPVAGPRHRSCGTPGSCADARRFRARSALQFYPFGLLLGLPVRLFPLGVLIDILSFVRLLLSQQPDNTHGIYRRRSGTNGFIALGIKWKRGGNRGIFRLCPILGPT